MILLARFVRLAVRKDCEVGLRWACLATTYIGL